jgi:hypothetical protein
VARRRGSWALALVVCLLVGVAAGGVVLGPEIARGGGILAASKRKFQALRNFALFHDKRDKAVLRWGEPPKGHAKKAAGN